MDITPDLSHLTEDERKIIEAVINRQKAEEKRDAAVLKTSHQDDYSAPVAMVSHRSSQQIRAKPSSITESGVCCEICQKTKFVGESSARQCSICKKRFCVRCGVRLKSTKTYWLCRVCREKQERYFSSRQLMPSTSSVSQITATSNNLHRSTDETSKQISKQYVSDYILSQPFDNNDEEEIHQNHSSPPVAQRKRILPTAHIQRQQKIGNVAEPPPSEDLRRNNNWQKDEILAAKLENFLSTSTTNWKWNENRTEQIGYVHLKNHNWSSSIHENEHQGKRMENDIFAALGLKIESRMIDEGNSTSVTEIVEVTAGSVADHYGQLQIGDQILEWNEHSLTNLDVNEISRIIAENPLETDDIRLIVKRTHRYSTNEQSSQETDATASIGVNAKKTGKPIRLQLSLQSNLARREFNVTVHGAKDLQSQQSSVVCQVSIQYRRDSSSKEDKTTKPRISSSGICTWNERFTFLDIDTLDNLSVWVKLLDLDRRQEILGEVYITLNDKTVNLQGLPKWYDLFPIAIHLPRCDSDLSEHEQSGSTVNRVLPTISVNNNKNNNQLEASTTDTSSTSNRKRQLPNIPAAQLHANREKVSQELIQKATELKLRLHMEQQRETKYAQEKRLMYEDRIQIFNNEAHRSTMAPYSSVSSQRSSFQSSKSIDADSPNTPPMPLATKAYESMTNLNQKPNVYGLREKTSRPRIPMIRDKSAPSTKPYLNPSLVRRTTTAGQHRLEMEKAKLKTLDDRCKKPMKKRDSSETPGEDVDSDGSELSTVSKISSVSMLSTQSERPRTSRKQGVHHFQRPDEVQLNEEEIRQMAMRTHDTMTHVPTTKTDTSVVPTPVATSNIPSNKSDPKNDGTLSDSVLSNQTESNKKRRPSMSSKALVILGLSKKTNSASNLGHGKRYGFQRSEEIGVQPHLRSRAFQRQLSKENETPSSAPATASNQSPLALTHQRDQHHSMPHDMKLWSGGLKLPHEHQFAEFIEGLGSGQLVGRQVLASPCHGEIQVGLRDQHGLLEVEIVRARNLLQKALYKMPPAPYVKVYLLDGKTCIEKQRTRSTRRTLDPLIQQTLIFKENYRDKVLQIGVWGDYGKLDRKVFMGVCQINLEELRLSTGAQVLDWFKLFSANSLMNNYMIVQQSPKRTLSVTTNDSFSSFKSNSRLN